MEWDTIRLETEGPVGYLILDRPASLNAVNDRLITDLEEACKAIQADTSLRVVILKGEGRAFCSGMDLRAASMRPTTTEAIRATWAPWERALQILDSLDQLTIASIHGPCLGAGFELILTCDFRIAAGTAFFSSPQVLYGSPADATATYRLPQLIGLAKAKEIIILGERFDAAKAEQWGLLTKVVEPGRLAEETQKLAERCLQVGWKAAAAVKHLLAQSWTMDLQDLVAGIDHGRTASLETSEFSESMEVYREKRKPRI
ncbi:MAG: enoyl-CoA hydratase/isomerase family protein [Deltaproteobacteria bacterium]|nr:enoyl-CoA hydratase/isomerase family protein [Deltaproteobacteria bacterium]